VRLPFGRGARARSRAAESERAAGAPSTSLTDLERSASIRRRPSGEPPPIPKPLSTAKYWLVVAAVVIVIWGVIFAGVALGPITHGDLWVLRSIASLRTEWLTRLTKSLDVLGSSWTVLVIRWVVVIGLLVVKRFRHLFVFLGSVLAVAWITSGVSLVMTRPRPLGIEILGHWQGSSQPSRPFAALTVTLIGICYSVVVPGRPRTVAKWVTAGILLVYAFVRLYLGVEHPTDILVSLVVGVTVPLCAFRLICPNEVFPVTYGRGRSAHLDVTGARGDAIKRALQDQLGLRVAGLAPFGLAGSGGSTPLRLELPGEPKAFLFAKLYARNHLRSDRWYKLGRTLLYGRLEDEGSFSTVRQLVQYEDYMLRVMRDAGLHTPAPYGFIEITPEREYLIVTEFVDGSKEILDAEVTDSVIDDGLGTVRTLWDAGLAHRDIKPSNLLVKDGKMHLIDVAFGEVRPTPWRQAVDLANMMIVLAFRTDPGRVYERALRFFTPEEIAEAFAATHKVTMPSQSRALLKKDRRNLIERFRELAPKRRPIPIQRWSYRRAALTIAVLFAAFLVVGTTIGNLPDAGLLPPRTSAASYATVERAPECGEPSDTLILISQSVPSATLLPCLDFLPLGWTFEGLSIRDGSTELFLDSDRAGVHAVVVDLAPSCDLSRATQIISDEPGTHRFEEIESIGAHYRGTRYYTFPGGCVSYDFDFAEGAPTSLANEATFALDFFSRAKGAAILKDLGFTL
jgi:tRNA A-37 threonylcarbamoyl transferase component Bud32